MEMSRPCRLVFCLLSLLSGSGFWESEEGQDGGRRTNEERGESAWNIRNTRSLVSVLSRAHELYCYNVCSPASGRRHDYHLKTPGLHPCSCGYVTRYESGSKDTTVPLHPHPHPGTRL